MTEHRADEVSVLADIDFDGIYQSGSMVPDAYPDMAIPWDIGEPQPVLVELVAAGAIASEVLDIGCGLGENAMFLAGEGYRVTGVDGSRTAIDKATAQAASRGLDASFAVADAITLDGYDGRFATVLDSALFHCLPPEKRATYAASLHRVTVPGARLHLICFTSEAGLGFGGGVTVTEKELRETFGEHWDITNLRQGRYTGAVTVVQFEQMLASVRETMPALMDLKSSGGLEADDKGRVRFPVWQLEAVRR